MEDVRKSLLAAVASVHTLLTAIFILMVGSSCITTLVSFRLEKAGHPATVIGIVATAYFIGLMTGSLRVIPLVQRVGHIRTFAAAVSILSASTLTYSLGQNLVLWTALRFIDGICVAGVMVCLESWLNDRAHPAMRGTVLAAYMIALYSGQSAGQFLLNLEGEPRLPFIVASMLISLASLPVMITRMPTPSLEEKSGFSIRKLYATSPLGAVGVAVTGVILGAFYAMGVVYARRIGLGSSGAALFMGVVIAGGVALQWPLGWLSDQFDRRRVILGVLATTGMVCFSFLIVPATPVAILPIGALFGGLVFALYPLCAGHTNDYLVASERIGASSGLILIYSAGAATGPLTGSIMLQAFGPAGLFGTLGACATIALIFGIWRLSRRDSLPQDQQQPYQPMTQIIPIAAQLERGSQDGAG